VQAVFYRAADGSEPVGQYLAKLPDPAAAVLFNQIERLNLLSASNPHLPFPHSSQIEGELRELRCHYGRELYRIFYRRSRNLFVLLHIFRKDTGQIPESEKRIARMRWEDFVGRMDANPRTPPRPAGSDAP
jgi:phage-related protein